MARVLYRRHGFIKRWLFRFWGRPLYASRRKRADILVEENERKLRQQQVLNKLKLEEIRAKDLDMSAEELEIKRSKIDYEKTRYDRMKQEEQQKIEDFTFEDEQDEPEAAAPEDLAESALNEVVKGVLHGVNRRGTKGVRQDQDANVDSADTDSRAAQEARRLLEEK